MRKTIEEGIALDAQVADVVANAMKDWAVDKGATHYTPLVPAADRRHRREARLVHHPRRPSGEVIMEFSGKELIQGEPDASSFPSRRAARHLRSPRLHGLGPHQPGLHQENGDNGSRCASRPPSAPITARRWTRRRRCCAPWRPLDKQAMPHPAASRQHNVRSVSTPPSGRSRSTS